MIDVLSELKGLISTRPTVYQFKQYLKKLTETEAFALHKSYWDKETGTYFSVLNYLIKAHSQQDNGFDYIVAVLQLNNEVNTHCSLHLAFELKQADIAQLLLIGEADVYIEPQVNETDEVAIVEDEEIQRQNLAIQVDIGKRDMHGQTLLARAIDLKNTELLNLLLQKKPDLNNEASFCSLNKKLIPLMPLHQTIAAGYVEGVMALIGAGVDISQACKSQGYTPALLAAKLGEIDSLSLLIQADTPTVIAEKTVQGKTAVDLLCERLQVRQDMDGAIKGIARLLFHGANAPSLAQHQDLLMEHRDVLVKELLRAQDGTSPVIFIHKIHSKTDPLHAIFFAQTALSNLMQHLSLKPSKVAWKLESLIGKDDDAFSDDERLFAQFTAEYKKAIKDQSLFNPFSRTRWQVGEGAFQSWEQICNYALANKKSRTAAIVREMEAKTPQISHELNGEDAPILF